MKKTDFPVYRLDQWTALRMQLLWAYRRHMAAMTDFSASTYSFQTALLIEKGWAEAGDSRSSLKRAAAGQWLIIRQGKRVQRFSKDCVLLSIGFRFQLPTGEAVFERGLPLCVEGEDHPALVRRGNEVLKQMRRHVGEGFFLRKQLLDMEHYLLSQNAFRLFLIELARVFHREGHPLRSLQQKNPRVIDALGLIDEALAVPGLLPKGGDIATRVGLSPTHLDRLMVLETGRTVYQHVEARRLLQVQDALLTRNSSLKVIAYDLGFSSPSHFNSWFRQRAGMTPLQYRKRHQVG